MPGLSMDNPSLSVSESQPDMIFVKKLTRPVVSEARMLRKNRVNRDICQFATKERKYYVLRNSSVQIV